MPSSKTSSLVHAAMPPKSSRHWKRCKRRSPPAASCRYSCSITRRCRRLCGVSQPFSGGRGSQVSQRCHGAGTPTAPSQSVNGFRFKTAEDAGAAGELRTNFAERLDVEGGSQDLDMYGKKGCGGWNFFRNSKEQLQFSHLHDRHCVLLRDELAEMQQVVAPLPIHRYRCAAEKAAAVHRIHGALNRHLKQEEVTNNEGTDGGEPPKPLRMLVSFCVCGPGRAKHERIRQPFLLGTTSGARPCAASVA